jgi:hypothetical protein
MDYCKSYMGDYLARQQQPGAAKLAASSVPLGSIAAGLLVSAGGLEDDYYDAARAQSPLSVYSALSGGSGRAPSSRTGPPVSRGWWWWWQWWWSCCRALALCSRCAALLCAGGGGEGEGGDWGR